MDEVAGRENRSNLLPPPPEPPSGFAPQLQGGLTTALLSGFAPQRLRGYRGGCWWRTQLERPEWLRAPPPLWGPEGAHSRWPPRSRPDAAGLAQVALGREEPWPRAGPGRHHRSPSTGLERSVGVATGVRVGGSHGLCAPRGLLVGYCGV
jgi:hypothetical protein